MSIILKYLIKKQAHSNFLDSFRVCLSLLLSAIFDELLYFLPSYASILPRRRLNTIINTSDIKITAPRAISIWRRGQPTPASL